MNKVILVGNVGRDPEIRTMSNGNDIATFSLATTDAEGNEKLCQILFTLESEEFGKKYVVFYEISELSDSDEDGDIPLMAASFIENEDGQGELSEIETDEEWEIMMRHTLINDYAMYEYLTEVENND